MLNNIIHKKLSITWVCGMLTYTNVLNTKDIHEKINLNFRANVCIVHMLINRLTDTCFLCVLLLLFFSFDFCRFCVVIQFFHPRYNGQWPPTSKDFLSQIWSIKFIFPILILEKEPVFSLLSVQCYTRALLVPFS